MKHLRDEYSIRCIIKNYNSNNSILLSERKHLRSLVVNKHVTIKELVDYLKEFNRSINLLNIDGKLVPQNITLGEGKNYVAPEREKNEVTKCLNVISSLKNTNLYNDIDWIIRLFKKAIYLSNTEEEKAAIISSLDDVLSSNEKFTSSDYTKLLETLMNQGNGNYISINE
jgi:hypothetical protein